MVRPGFSVVMAMVIEPFPDQRRNNYISHSLYPVDKYPPAGRLLSYGPVQFRIICGGNGNEGSLQIFLESQCEIGVD